MKNAVPKTEKTDKNHIPSAFSIICMTIMSENAVKRQDSYSSLPTFRRYTINDMVTVRISAAIWA